MTDEAGHSYVCFRATATGKDQLRAAVQASLQHYLHPVVASEEVEKVVHEVVPVLMEVLRTEGWKVDMLLLRPRGAQAYLL
jgi:3-deoxy-D-manno-octulosonic-acid transferase